MQSVSLNTPSWLQDGEITGLPPSLLNNAMRAATGGCRQPRTIWSEWRERVRKTP